MMAAPPAPRPSDVVIAELRTFLTERHDAALADARRSLAPHICLELGRRGLAGLMRPREQGGCNLSLGEALRVIRFLASADLSLSVGVGIHNILGLGALTRFGSPAARAALEADCARGARLCAFALTETEAGSDPRRLTTTAHRQADGSWLLHGTKRWIGLGAWCGAVVTFAQAYDEHDRPLGISGFVFPAETPGFVVGEEAMTLGVRGVFQGALHFKNLRVAATGLLGRPGAGLAQAQEVLKAGRLACVAFASGAMQRSVQIAARYVAKRKIATGTMADNGVVSDALAKMLAQTFAIDRFFDWLCTELDATGSLADELYCAAKIVAPEWAFRVADGCMQLLGARGYEETNVVARVFRDIRLMRIFEGPTETIRYHLGGLINRSDVVLRALLCDHLNSGDVLETISVALTRIRGGEAAPSRAEQHRTLSWLGEIAALGLLWAIVRQSDPGDPAARIAGEHFHRAAETPLPRNAWAGADELARLNAACEALTGDVDPHQPGEQRSPDPTLFPVRSMPGLNGHFDHPDASPKLV